MYFCVPSSGAVTRLYTDFWRLPEIYDGAADLVPPIYLVLPAPDLILLRVWRTDWNADQCSLQTTPAGSPRRHFGLCRSVVYGYVAVRCEVGRARGDPVFYTRCLAPHNFSEQTKKVDPMDWSNLRYSVEF